MFRNKAEQRTILSVKADDGIVDKITSTPGHKYYLPDNKQNRTNEQLEHASYVGLNENWVSAGLLKNGDKVLLANADSLTGKPKYGIVMGVKTEECDEFTTYNFEVEDFHTYYVGENGVCVHNASPCELVDGELYTDSFNSNGVDVDVIAEVKILGNEVILDNIVIYPRGRISAVNEVGEVPFIHATKRVIAQAKSQGFTSVTVKGVRVPNSSSPVPNFIHNRTFHIK